MDWLIHIQRGRRRRDRVDCMYRLADRQRHVNGSDSIDVTDGDEMSSIRIPDLAVVYCFSSSPSLSTGL